MIDPSALRLRQQVRGLAGATLVLAALQVWLLWPASLRAGVNNLLSQPSGARVSWRDGRAQLQRSGYQPLGRTPLVLPIPATLPAATLRLELAGYQPLELTGRSLRFETTAGGDRFCRVSLQPKVPLLVSAAWWGLRLAPALGAALLWLLFWRRGWLPWVRQQRLQAARLNRLAAGEVVEGVRLGMAELGPLLGQGGMGAVFQARPWARGGQGWPLAVKLLTGQASQESRERFLREADVLRRLSHPQIVPLLDWGEEAGQLFLVMERLEGVPLTERMPQARPELVLDWARQLSSGLAYAHERELVHRDLKPSNVMVTPQGRLILMDFGIAARADLPRLTQAGDAMGTPGYMAPEQLRGESVDYRADLFSLGVLLYEALAGRRPFEGDTLMEVISKQLQGVYAPLGPLAPEAPPALVALVERLLSPAPEERAQSPAQVQREIQELSMV